MEIHLTIGTAGGADDAGDSAGWTCRWRVADEPPGAEIAWPVGSSQSLVNGVRAVLDAFGERGADGRSRLRHKPVSEVAALGRSLDEACCGPLRAALVSAPPGERHDLVIHSTLPDALNLPWELLPLGHGDGPIGCDKAWRVLRTPLDALPSDDGRLPGGPLRILFLAAAPLDQQNLDYEKEEDAILRATLRLQGAVLFFAELGTLEELKELLPKVRPHVVHLSGRGKVGKDGVGRFCFEDEGGHTDLKSAADLVHEALSGSGVRCVFLNACETSRAAVSGLCQDLVRAGVPAAIGWAASVADERATQFAETFYESLAAGEPVPAAMAVARLRIQKLGVLPRAHHGEDVQELTYLLPQLYCSLPVEKLYDASRTDAYQGPRTQYERLGNGVEGLREGFVGRRREQQRMLPKLRTGDFTVLLLCGMGGQGKSTLATRVANRLGMPVIAVKSVRNAEAGETAADCARRTVRELMGEFRTLFTERGRGDLVKILNDPDTPDDQKLIVAANALNDLPVCLVLDNFEDVLDEATRRFGDDALAAFYRRVQTHVVRGSRVLVTSRYPPDGTRHDLPNVKVWPPLHDFSEHDFLKFLKRSERVAERLRRGELPADLMTELYGHVGGTPRFLGQVRTLLATFAVADLRADLARMPERRDAGQSDEEASRLAALRAQYLESIFGPRLFGLLSEAAQRVVTRLAVSRLPVPLDAVRALADIPEERAARQAVQEGRGTGCSRNSRNSKLRRSTCRRACGGRGCPTRPACPPPTRPPRTARWRSSGRIRSTATANRNSASRSTASWPPAGTTPPARTTSTCSAGAPSSSREACLASRSSRRRSGCWRRSPDPTVPPTCCRRWLTWNSASRTGACPAGCPNRCWPCPGPTHSMTGKPTPRRCTSSPRST